MIKINNNIDKHIQVTFYHDGVEIGECTNALAFFDVLCQIKAEGDDRYSLTVKKTLQNGDERTFVFKVTPNGRLSPAAQNNITLWSDILCTQLLYLDGFKDNFFYDNTHK